VEESAEQIGANVVYISLEVIYLYQESLKTVFLILGMLDVFEYDRYIKPGLTGHFLSTFHVGVCNIVGVVLVVWSFSLFLTENGRSKVV
jgi:hypothetical protein